jgi:chaperonin GroES
MHMHAQLQADQSSS